MNMVDETKLRSPIHLTFEVLFVRCVVGHCHGEELGPFLLAEGVAVFDASHRFAEQIKMVTYSDANYALIG